MHKLTESTISLLNSTPLFTKTSMAQTRNLLTFVGLALVATVAFASPRPAVLVDDPPIFPLSKVERGLRGEGYTVFASADGPERFEFVVLGVMRNYLGPGEDLIIARLIGEKIERTGVISGMSGSPVFVDGKLVGAVGYRFGAFTKDPIAGITPIERMLAVADAPKGGGVARSGSSTRSRALATREVLGGHETRETFGASPYGIAEPIAVPLVMSGLEPAVAGAFQGLLAERGYGPLLAGGSVGAAEMSVSTPGGSKGTSKAQTGERLYPAGPIAGLLVGGAVDMAAVGTVTWVKGDRFLAFGHPFRGSGRSAVPVASAHILTTVPSASGSFKLGQASGVVGRLTDDRVHAIAGTLGPPPKTVPVTIRLTTAGPRSNRDQLRDIALDIVRDREDSPLFTAISLANVLTNRVSLEEGGTVVITGKARFSTGDVVDIAIRESVEGSSAVFVMAALSLLGTLTSVVDQGFAEVLLESVDLDVRVDTVVDTRRIVAFDAVNALVPGEQGRLRVRLRPHRGAVEDRFVDVRIPEGVKPGVYTLIVADSRASMRIESETGLVPQPQTFADVLALVRARPAPETYSLYLVFEDSALRLDGRSLSGLPASYSGLLTGGGGLSGGLVDERSVRLTRMTTDSVVVGEARGKIEIPAPESR
jgi:hypothetical protein